MKLIGEDGLRVALAANGPDTWQIVDDAGLDLNSRYTDLLSYRDFSSISVVVRTSGRLVGRGVGYVRPSAPETVFVW